MSTREKARLVCHMQPHARGCSTMHTPSGPDQSHGRPIPLAASCHAEGVRVASPPSQALIVYLHTPLWRKWR